MNLTYEQIRALTFGAARVETENGYTRFYRFTKQQQSAYQNRNDDFFKKTFSSALVSVEFKTDSNSLFLDGYILSASSRRFFAFDIKVNGELKFCLKDHADNETLKKDFKIELDLGSGEKAVKICFPWSAATFLKTLSLDDGADVSPINKSKTALIFGDSITQGYDSSTPSKSYAFRLAESLDANALNKAIGGEVFWGDLGKMTDSVNPDYIFTAYGTNDWTRNDKTVFCENCKSFFENLSAAYPKAEIFAITPIWRTDYLLERDNFPFFFVRDYIKQIADGISNITVIDGFPFLPHDASLLSDHVHPNDKGFDHYIENLLKTLKESGI